MTWRLVRLAVVIAAGVVVACVVAAFLPLAVALTYTWRGAFPERRRSTLPEWIGAAALVWIACRARLNTRAIER